MTQSAPCRARAELCGVVVAITLLLTTGFAGGVDFSRGDASVDGRLSLIDPIVILNYLIGDGSLECRDAADGNDDGMINIVDPVYLLHFLFQAGASPPPDPFPLCGADPTDDALDCVNDPACP